MRINSIDMSDLQAVRDRGKDDLAELWTTKRVSGSWDLTGDRPMFQSTIPYGDDESTEVTMDVTPILGLPGRAPDPLEYFLAGLAACYSTSVLLTATLEGVEVSALSASAQLKLDTSQAFDLTDNQPIRGVAVDVRITADADAETLQRWHLLARSRCPYAFIISNELELATSLKPH